MNKRYYEHTLPIIRGSLSNTYHCAICFTVCHPVSLREEKREAEKRESQRKKQGKAPD